VRAACEAAGRDPDTITFSLMHGLALGADAAQADDRARRLGGAEGWVRGTPEQVVERLREYEAVGVERVMLQQLLHDDLEHVSLLGEVATRLH